MQTRQEIERYIEILKGLILQKRLELQGFEKEEELFQQKLNFYLD
jgi:hypothetical protein